MLMGNLILPGEDLRNQLRFLPPDLLQGAGVEGILLYSGSGHIILLCNPASRPMPTGPIFLRFTHVRCINGVLVLPKSIAYLGNNLLIFILHSNQKFAGFLGDVSSAKLVGTDPGDSCLTAFKFHLFGSKGDTVAHTNLIAIMTVNNDTVPDNNRIPAAIGENILFQLCVFPLPQRTDQMPELLVNFQFPQSHYIASILSTSWMVLSGKTAAFSSDTISPVSR